MILWQTSDTQLINSLVPVAVSLSLDLGPCLNMASHIHVHQVDMDHEIHNQILIQDTKYPQSYPFPPHIDSSIPGFDHHEVQGSIDSPGANLDSSESKLPSELQNREH